MYAPAMTGGFRDFYRPDPAIERAPPAEGIKGNGRYPGLTPAVAAGSEAARPTGFDPAISALTGR